jgi:hypothetical protein
MNCGQSADRGKFNRLDAGGQAYRLEHEGEGFGKHAFPSQPFHAKASSERSYASRDSSACASAISGIAGVAKSLRARGTSTPTPQIVAHVSSLPPASVAWTDISPQSDSSGVIAVAISSDGILTAISDGQVFYLYSLGWRPSSPGANSITITGPGGPRP